MPSVVSTCRQVEAFSSSAKDDRSPQPHNSCRSMNNRRSQQRPRFRFPMYKEPGRFHKRAGPRRDDPTRLQLPHRDLRDGFAMPFKASARAAVGGLSHPRWLWSYLTNGMPVLKNFPTYDASDTASRAAILRRQIGHCALTPDSRCAMGSLDVL